MWGSETVVVNSSAVDRIESSLRTVVETRSGYHENPVEAVTQVFRRFDVNNSGKLTLQEFLEAMRKLNFHGFDNDVTALFRRYDMDRSGTLEFEEFGNALFCAGNRKLKATSTIGKVREALAARAGGFQTLKDMGRQFKIMDQDGNNQLSKEEMRRGMDLFLRAFDLKLKNSEINRIFNLFDKDGDGEISYDEFLRGIRGDMNEARVALVKLAFKVLDTDDSGTITLDEMAAKYNVNEHPKVKSGEITHDQALQELMAVWDKDGDGTTTIEEFIEYYQWISCTIPDDDYFELMIRNAWHLSGGEGWSENTTCRRVLVFHEDGHESVEEIKDDFGIGVNDTDKMMENLRKQGIKPVKIELNF